MTKAGKIMLLTFILLLMSKATLHAQELVALKSDPGTTNQICTALNSYLVIKNSTCNSKSLSQLDKKVAASLNDNTEDNPKTISYELESSFYIPPTPTPTRTIIKEQQNISPTPTQAKKEEQIPEDLLAASGANLDSDLIFRLINQHRSQIGKPAFLKDEALCSLATTRSVELHDELFINHNLHSGLYNRNLPYWITENAKWGSNEAGTVKWWLSSPIHRRAIEGDYTYSCGACSGSQCSQLFTSYAPKGN